MSKTTMKRLWRLETASSPSTLGLMHIIYAKDRADFEGQRADLIASGAVSPSDLVTDWNAGLPVDQHETGEPESFPVTRTHEEWVDILSQKEHAR